MFPGSASPSRAWPWAIEGRGQLLRPVGLDFLGAQAPGCLPVFARYSAGVQRTLRTPSVTNTNHGS